MGNPKSYSFFLVDGFDLHAVAACIEALHCANSLAGQKYYAWRIVGERGSPVVSGSGIIVPISGIAVERVRFDSIVVCASGTAAVNFQTSEIFAWLRRAEKFGAAIGGIDCGAWILARAGLLDDRSAAIAGDHAAGFRETFDRVLLTGEGFVIDGNRFTSAGGLAGLDLFIRRVGNDLGDEIAAAVAVRMNRAVGTAAKSSGPRPLSERLGVTHEKLAQCIAMMEANIETPISSRELAERTDLSVRHLERLFVNHFKQTPQHFYRKFRLEHARRLLLQTALPVAEVAVASGFPSFSHFSRLFRQTYGMSPMQMRQQNKSWQSSDIVRNIL